MDFNVNMKENCKMSTYNNDDMKINGASNKDYIDVDVQTRSRVSLRRTMQQKCRDGTFYQNANKIRFKKVEPFMDPDDFQHFGDDDDWKTVDDGPWSPSCFA